MAALAEGLPESVVSPTQRNPPQKHEKIALRQPTRDRLAKGGFSHLDQRQLYVGGFLVEQNAEAQLWQF